MRGALDAAPQLWSCHLQQARLPATRPAHLCRDACRRSRLPGVSVTRTPSMPFTSFSKAKSFSREATARTYQGPRSCVGSSQHLQPPSPRPHPTGGFTCVGSSLPSHSASTLGMGAKVSRAMSRVALIFPGSTGMPLSPAHQPQPGALINSAAWPQQGSPSTPWPAWDATQRLPGAPPPLPPAVPGGCPRSTVRLTTHQPQARWEAGTRERGTCQPDGGTFRELWFHRHALPSSRRTPSPRRPP